MDSSEVTGKDFDNRLLLWSVFFFQQKLQKLFLLLCENVVLLSVFYDGLAAQNIHHCSNSVSSLFSAISQRKR